jgi:hypothetical protein
MSRIKATTEKAAADRESEKDQDRETSYDKEFISDDVEIDDAHDSHEDGESDSTENNSKQDEILNDSDYVDDESETQRATTRQSTRLAAAGAKSKYQDRTQPTIRIPQRHSTLKSQSILSSSTSVQEDTFEGIDPNLFFDDGESESTELFPSKVYTLQPTPILPTLTLLNTATSNPSSYFDY